jgi:hypothetical protein
MVEIVAGIVCHGELVHYPPRPHVSWNRKSDNFIQRECFEAVTQRCASALRCQALPPIRGRQPPADFDARRKMGAETWHIQSDKADECAIATMLSGEQAEAALAKVLLNSIHTFIALGAR